MTNSFGELAVTNTGSDNAFTDVSGALRVRRPRQLTARASLDPNEVTADRRAWHRYEETGLRIALPGRIMVVPRASALGSGPGCPPFGGGAGFCALRTQFRDVVEQRSYEREPASAGAVRPRDRVSDPKQWLAQALAMVEHQRWLREARPDDRSLIVSIVLSALDRQSGYGPLLEQPNDLRQTRVPRVELAQTMAARADDDRDPLGHRGEQLER